MPASSVAALANKLVGTPPPETTGLSPGDERAFQAWAAANHITDVDEPDTHYDYRGFWRSTAGAPHPPGSDMHFPDTFKQHGHPTFSVESQYSQGPYDGGRWVGDQFIPPGADMLSTSRGARITPLAVGDALRAALQR